MPEILNDNISKTSSSLVIAGQGLLFNYTLHLADNALIIGQRNAEWCGHGPVLEQDIAITNISLDLLGQAKNFYEYAATIYNNMKDEEKIAADYLIPRLWKNYNRSLNEDDLAFLRDEHQYLNILLAEQPNGDWAKTILRQFFFSAYQYFLYQQLQHSNNEQLAAIAEKSLKEVTYHLRWSSEWVIRLGDGTAESNLRIKNALNDLWMFTGELFSPADYELSAASSGFGTDVSSLQQNWQSRVLQVFKEAALSYPYQQQQWMQSGGKKGKHTEHLGYILTEMQYLQRAYPNATW